MWGVSQELMVETLSKEALRGWLEKGISNVAYISIALGLENIASNAFIEAKVSVTMCTTLSLYLLDYQPLPTYLYLPTSILPTLRQAKCNKF